MPGSWYFQSRSSMSARATTTTRCWSRRRLQLPKCCQCGFWWLCIPGLKLVVYEEKLIGLTREKETQSGVKADWCGPAVVQTQWHWSRPIIGPVLIVHKPTFAASSYQLVNHCQQQPFNTNLKRYQKYTDGHWTDQRKQDSICAEGFLILNLVFQKIHKKSAT